MVNTRRNDRLLSLALVVTFVATFALSVLGIFGGNEVAQASYTSAYDAEYVGNYYNGLNTDLRGDNFRDKLATLITTTHKKQTSYDGLKGIFDDSDVDLDGKNGMKLFYTGTVVKSYSSYGANREHVWPKNGGKAFPASSKCGSDAHHLRPCDQQLNSTRGSLSFGEVAQTVGNIVKQNGSSDYGNLCYKSGSFFYPGVGYRGATARILMYVQTRWGNDYTLTFVDGSGNNKTIGDFDTLYKWHLEEPPTREEIYRNNCVAAIQGNRNPFIDHPEYAYYIYSQAGSYYSSSDSNTLANSVKALTESKGDPYGNLSVVSPTAMTLNKQSITLEEGLSETLTVSTTPANASKRVTWTTANKDIAMVDGGKITAVGVGTTTITATSAVDASVKATAMVTVTKAKEVNYVTVNGNPVKKVYTEGNMFNPSGLTVSVIYDDGSTEDVSADLCDWLDGVTGLKTLSQGTTSVVCMYRGKQSKPVEGITVNANPAGGSSITITRESFDTSGSAYDWYPWKEGGISGEAYIYSGKQQVMQFNSDREYRYLYNKTPLPDGAKTITIKGHSTNQNAVPKWTILTQSTPYSQVSGVPSTGTKYSEQTVTDEGISWTITTGEKYFAVCYVGSGAVYIEEITITYGSGGAVTPCNHEESGWIVDRPATCTGNGSKHTECNKCGQTIKTETISATGHDWDEWLVLDDPTCTEEGMKARECKKCHELDELGIPKLPHKPTDWQTVKEPTCSEDGQKVQKCVNCDEVIATEVIRATGHEWSSWEKNEDGTKIRTCNKCHKTETLTAVGEQFVIDVNALSEITDQSARFDKICALLKQYNAMSAEERANLTESIKLLDEYIAEYNAWATSRNTAHADVVDSVLCIVYRLAGFASLLFVFRKIGGVK